MIGSDKVFESGEVGEIERLEEVVRLLRVVSIAAEFHFIAANGLAIEGIDWLVPHQANLRILEGVARKLGISRDRIIVTVDRHANTSAASIPLALDEAIRDGRIKRGDLVLMEAMGGGLTWGAALVRW